MASGAASPRATRCGRRRRCPASPRATSSTPGSPPAAAASPSAGLSIDGVRLLRALPHDPRHQRRLHAHDLQRGRGGLGVAHAGGGPRALRRPRGGDPRRAHARGAGGRLPRQGEPRGSRRLRDTRGADREEGHLARLRAPELPRLHPRAGGRRPAPRPRLPRPDRAPRRAAPARADGLAPCPLRPGRLREHRRTLPPLTPWSPPARGRIFSCSRGDARRARWPWGEQGSFSARPATTATPTASSATPPSHGRPASRPTPRGAGAPTASRAAWRHAGSGRTCCRAASTRGRTARGSWRTISATAGSRARSSRTRGRRRGAARASRWVAGSTAGERPARPWCCRGRPSPGRPPRAPASPRHSAATPSSHASPSWPARTATPTSSRSAPGTWSSPSSSACRRACACGSRRTASPRAGASSIASSTGGSRAAASSGRAPTRSS